MTSSPVTAPIEVEPADKKPSKFLRRLLTKLTVGRRWSVAVLLILADIAALVVAALAGLVMCAAISQVSVSQVVGELQELIWYALPVMLAAGYCASVYARFSVCYLERDQRRLLATVIFFALLAICAAVVVAPGWLKFAFVTILSTVFFVAGYWFERLVRKFIIDRWVDPVATVVVGDGDEAAWAFEHLAAVKNYGLKPVALISQQEFDQISRMLMSADGGHSQSDGAADMATAPADKSASEAVQMANVLQRAKFWVVTSPDKIEAEAGLGRHKSKILVATRIAATGIAKSDASPGSNQPLALHPLRSQPGALYAVAKRSFDILFAGAGLILVAPILLVAMALVKLIDPGPALYYQERACRDGRLRRIYKIRTMYVDASERLERHLSENPAAKSEWQTYFKLSDDPRILPWIGKFLRLSSIDELPQLWNVIVGDMSLVGPRPFPTYHLKSFDKEFRQTRASVQPGLTGFWQIKSRSSGDLEAQKRQDLYYIQNRSAVLDLYIVLMTIPAVLTARGAR